MADTPATKPAYRESTDRVRRRAGQATNANQAKAEGTAMVSPGGPAKKAAIAADKAKEQTKFGGRGKSERAHIIQAENKAKAVQQDLDAPAPKPVEAGPFVPGTTPTLLEQRRFMKAHDHAEKSEIDDAARAAGRAVRDTLKGRGPRDRHSRQRRIEQANAALAAAKAAPAKVADPAKTATT